MAKKSVGRRTRKNTRKQRKVGGSKARGTSRGVQALDQLKEMGLTATKINELAKTVHLTPAGCFDKIKIFIKTNDMTNTEFSKNVDENIEKIKSKILADDRELDEILQKAADDARKEIADRELEESLKKTVEEFKSKSKSTKHKRMSDEEWIGQEIEKDLKR